MQYDARLGTAQSSETTMVFGTCELTTTQLENAHPADLLDLLLLNGVKRLAAERIIEIHCGGDTSPGRARTHTTSRGSSMR